MKYMVLFLPFLLLFAGSCRNSARPADAFTRNVYVPEYAGGFEIKGADGMESTLLKVRDPWQGAEKVEMTYFISRNGEEAPEGFQGVVIPSGARRIVCMSSSYIAMLEAMGEASRVAGVSGLDYISSPYINAHRDKVSDLGPEINYEILAGISPDLVLLFGIGEAQSAVTDKLQELEIPYMYVGEYLEESPLGKAEWMVALAELIGCREKGEKIFRAIPPRYNHWKELAAGAGKKPTVMLNVPWNDSWSMPSVRSYIARLVEDAGGEYIYRGNTGNASEPVGLETAYGLISRAEFWMNVGTVTSLEQLKALNPKFGDARAIRENKVYNNNLRLTPGGGNDYWESATVRPDLVLRDLVSILHPELCQEELYYHRHLE